MSFLVKCEILGVFVDTLTAEDRYPLHNCDNLLLPIQMQLSKKWKTFSRFFVSFLQFTWNSKHPEKKMIVTTNVFPEFKTSKYVVRQISKKCRFRTTFDSQHDKEPQRPVKSAWHHFYHTSPSLWAKLIWKMSLLVICEILRGFVNTLTADDKYPLRNCENLPLPIEIQLSKKLKTFPQSFVPILQSPSNLKPFEKKRRLS